MLRLRARSLLLAAALTGAVGCASSRATAPAAAVPPPEAGAPSPVLPPAGPAATPAAEGGEAKAAAAPSDRRARREGPCSEPPTGDEKVVDRAQRRLTETLCSASLWFDGLFGEQTHVDAARRATGRIELSMIGSEYEGTEPKVNFHVRVALPNLENRYSAFLGRESQDDFIRDRREGFALSSQFVRLESNEKWLAGFGYALPGSYKQRLSFNVGAHGGRQPEVFAQGRYRRNLDFSEYNLWHFRETVFWTNRDGFGSTTSLDYDHLFSSTLMLRWGTIGTFSESTAGLDWRSAIVTYKNLPGRRALALEAFARGATEAEVDVKEYGGRAIYRQTIARRNWLFGEAVLGYTWPREWRHERREGSLTVGIGIELMLGRQPYW